MDTNTATTTSRYIGSRYFERVNDSEIWEEICGRCGGRGYIAHYAHIDGGVCYASGCSEGILGRFTTQELDRKEDERNKREAAKEAKRLAICAERDARVERMTAQYPDVMAVLKATYDTYNGGEGTRVNAFLLGLAEQVLNAKGKDLTEAQVQAVRNSIAREAERAAVDAKRPDVPEGKLTITGTVVSTKVQHGDYGTTYKMLVEAEQGFKVFGTIPSSMLEQYTLEELKATKVTFTATVERSRDDRSFGFFKRPTKGVVHS